MCLDCLESISWRLDCVVRFRDVFWKYFYCRLNFSMSISASFQSIDRASNPARACMNIKVTFVSFCLLLAFTFVLWLFSVLRRDTSIIDIGWSLYFLLVS